MNKLVFDISNLKCIDFVKSFKDCKQFVQFFQERYEFVIAYHATNLNDEEIISIKENGICIADKELLINKAKKRFLDNSDDKYKKDIIINQIEEYFQKPLFSLENTVCFCFAKNNLIEDCYHYLLFGSEALLPVASILRKKLKCNFKERLVVSGNHYLLKVKIAVKDIESFWFENIYDNVVNNSSERGFKIEKALVPESIIEFIKVERPNDYKNLVKY